MKIQYICDCCGEPIDLLEIDAIDEAKLGFDCLSGDEREELISIDNETGIMYVQSICDQCIETLGITGNAFVLPGSGYLH